jgi:hypothetical protein
MEHLLWQPAGHSQDLLESTPTRSTYIPDAHTFPAIELWKSPDAARSRCMFSVLQTIRLLASGSHFCRTEQAGRYSGNLQSQRRVLDSAGTARCLFRPTLLRLTRAVAVLLLPLISGCGNEDVSVEQSEEVSNAVRSEVERGPVKFTVEFTPEKARLSDEPQLTLTIRAQQGVRVEKPPFGAALGDFQIRDFHEPPPDLDADTEIIRQVYTLEPTRAGKLTVAPIAVRFHDERKDGDGKEHTIESEALTVEISTVLGDEAPSLADLRPAAGPVELPVDNSSAWFWSVGIVAALVLAAAIAWKVLKRGVVAEPQLSPQELAWLELEQIIERKLAESDVKEFYVELTGVVRRYIERSTGVHAAEQTTEEFLREILADAIFAEVDQQRLRDFLESADLVKFAAFEPAAADIEASFDRAKEFIQLQRGTTPQEVAA